MRLYQWREKNNHTSGVLIVGESILIDAHSNMQGYSDLWHLDDWRVESLTGGMVLLAPRKTCNICDMPIGRAGYCLLCNLL